MSLDEVMTDLCMQPCRQSLTSIRSGIRLLICNINFSPHSTSGKILLKVFARIPARHDFISQVRILMKHSAVKRILDDEN